MKTSASTLLFALAAILPAFVQANCVAGRRFCYSALSYNELPRADIAFQNAPPDMIVQKVANDGTNSVYTCEKGASGNMIFSLVQHCQFGCFQDPMFGGRCVMGFDSDDDFSSEGNDDDEEFTDRQLSDKETDVDEQNHQQEQGEVF